MATKSDGGSRKTKTKRPRPPPSASDDAEDVIPVVAPHAVRIPSHPNHKLAVRHAEQSYVRAVTTRIVAADRIAARKRTAGGTGTGRSAAGTPPGHTSVYGGGNDAQQQQQQQHRKRGDAFLTTSGRKGTSSTVRWNFDDAADNANADASTAATDAGKQDRQEADHIVAKATAEAYAAALEADGTSGGGNGGSKKNAGNAGEEEEKISSTVAGVGANVTASSPIDLCSEDDVSPTAPHHADKNGDVMGGRPPKKAKLSDAVMEEKKVVGGKKSATEAVGSKHGEKEEEDESDEDEDSSSSSASLDGGANVSVEMTLPPVLPQKAVLATGRATSPVAKAMNGDGTAAPDSEGQKSTTNGTGAANGTTNGVANANGKNTTSGVAAVAAPAPIPAPALTALASAASASQQQQQPQWPRAPWAGNAGVLNNSTPPRMPQAMPQGMPPGMDWSLYWRTVHGQNEQVTEQRQLQMQQVEMQRRFELQRLQQQALAQAQAQAQKLNSAGAGVDGSNPYSTEAVRARTLTDGSVVPIVPTKRDVDGLFLKPTGRGRMGMVWDAVNGLWVPEHRGNSSGHSEAETEKDAQRRFQQAATNQNGGSASTAAGGYSTQHEAVTVTDKLVLQQRAAEQPAQTRVVWSVDSPSSKVAALDGAAMADSSRTLLFGGTNNAFPTMHQNAIHPLPGDICINQFSSVPAGLAYIIDNEIRTLPGLPDETIAARVLDRVKSSGSRNWQGRFLYWFHPRPTATSGAPGARWVVLPEGNAASYLIDAVNTRRPFVNKPSFLRAKTSTDGKMRPINATPLLAKEIELGSKRPRDTIEDTPIAYAFPIKYDGTPISAYDMVKAEKRQEKYNAALKKVMKKREKKKRGPRRPKGSGGGGKGPGGGGSGASGRGAGGGGGRRKMDGEDFGGRSRGAGKGLPPKEVYERSAAEFGEGWTVKGIQRMSGKYQGHVDNYWFTPKKKKKLRSRTEVKRFLEALSAVDGDEDKAFAILRKRGR